MLVPVTSRYSESVASLHDALITQGVAPDDLAALMAWPPYRGLGLAERVYRSGLVSDARLVEALVSLGATDATQLVLAATPPPAALGAFTRALAQRHRALPLSIERRRLVVALLDPGDAATLEKLSHVCGLAIEPRACRPRVLFERLARAYDAVVVKPEPGFLHSRRAALVAATSDADAGSRAMRTTTRVAGSAPSAGSPPTRPSSRRPCARRRRRRGWLRRRRMRRRMRRRLRRSPRVVRSLRFRSGARCI